MTIVTRADLERRQTVSLADYLATTPGIAVSRNGGPGAVTSLSIRGAQAEQTLVLIDGVRVNDPSSPAGAFDFGSLLAGSIARVEVLRGPDSVPWGSQAIGGVVNVVTEKPGEGVQARGSAEYGGPDSVYATAGVSGRSGALSGALTGGWLSSDGISQAAVGTERDGTRQIGGTGRIGIDLAPGIGLDLRGYYAHSRIDLDGYAPTFPFAFGDNADFSTAQEIYGHAGLHVDVAGGRLRNRLAFTIADVNRDNYDPTLGAAPTFIGRGRSERYAYQGDYTLTRAIRIVAGAEHEDSRYFDGTTRAATGVTSVYGELIARPVAALTLTGGVRQDDHRQFGGHTTLGANAALTLGEGTTLRASYGEGFKAPTLFQLFSNYGTPGLRPETAHGYDLGVEQVLGSALRASATWFRRDSKGLIDFRACSAGEAADRGSICFDRPNGTYANIDRAQAEGVELALALRPVTALDITASYSHIATENRTPGPDLGNALARRPRDNVSVSADYRFPFGLSVGGTVQTVGDSYDNAANTVRLDGYALASVRAEMPVGRHLSVYGRIENLFDARYQTVATYGTLGRAAYAGVRVRFE